MTEKRKPTYDLATFQSWALSDLFQMTGTALRTALALGFTQEDVIKVTQTMTRDHFQKSMTTYADHKVWQDVYYVPSRVGELYVKFRADAVAEFTLLSFKEQTDG